MAVPARLRPEWAAGARAAVAVGFSFGVATLVSGPESGTFAALGCYIDAYGGREPYPRRGRLLIAVAGGAVAAFLVGSLAAADIWLAVAVLPVVAFAATLFIRTLHFSGPGSYRIMVIAAVSAFLPFDPAHIPLEAGYLLFGAATTWLVSMSGCLARRYGPEERAVAAACRGVADFTEAAGRDLPATRQAAYLAVNGAWRAIDDARGTGGPAPPRRLILYALLCRLEGALDAAETASRDRDAPRPGPGPAPGPSRDLREAADEIAAGRTPVTPPGTPPAGLAARSRPSGGRAATPDPAPDPLLLREAGLLWPVPLPPRKSIGAELRRLLSASSPAPTIARRVAYAVAAGAVLGALLPLMHPSWVTIGATAALQGGPGQQPHLRAGKRLVGTVLGVAGTALAFVAYQPGAWATVTLATVVHAAARTVTDSSVFLGMALATPFSLLIAYAGNPAASLGTLAAYRLLDVSLGLLLGLAAALLVPGVPSRRVHAAVAGAVEATGSALRERLRTGSLTDGSEGLAWRRTADLFAMYASVPVEEIRSNHAAERLWALALAVRRLLSWSMLGPAAAPAPDEAERVDAFMGALAGSARTGAPGFHGRPDEPGAPGLPPEVPGRPLLRSRLRALASALETPGSPARGDAPPR